MTKPGVEFNTPWKRNDTTPNWMAEMDPSPVPDDLVPHIVNKQPDPTTMGPEDLTRDLRIRVKYKSAAELIAAGEELPEVSTALSGLRLALAERKAQRLEKRLLTLAQEQRQLRFIGQSVLKGEGYLSRDLSNIPRGVDRPSSNLTKGPGNRLTWLQQRRLNVTRNMYQISSAHPDVVGKKQTFWPFFREYDKSGGAKTTQHIKLSWGERRNKGVNARKYRNHSRMLKFYDRAFRHIVSKPARDAKGLAKERDKTVLKAAALRAHRP